MKVRDYDWEDQFLRNYVTGLLVNLVLVGIILVTVGLTLNDL